MALVSAQGEEEEENSTMGGPDYGFEGAGGEAEVAAAVALEQETLPQNWYVYTDNRGVFYYHNPLLNITQWERPAGVVPPACDSGSVAPAGIAEDACTLDLSFAGGDAAAVAGALGSETAGGSRSSSSYGDRAAPGRRALGGGGGTEKSGGSTSSSNGFLSLAVSPLDVRQKLQQERSRTGRAPAAGGESFFSHLSSNSTAASSRLQHGYGGGVAGEAKPAAAGSERDDAEDLFWLLRCCGCLSFYTALQRLFAVTTDDICSRLRIALLPCKRGAAAEDSSGSGSAEDATAAELLKRPDMYGPFWVATTLVVLVFACSNFPLLLSPAAAAAAGAATDVRRLGQAAAAVYGCFLLPPVVVWVALLYYTRERKSAVDNLEAAAALPRRGGVGGGPIEKEAPALEQLLCVQGYAFTPLCACSAFLLLLQVLPGHITVTILQWIATIAAGAVAAVFLFQQLRHLLGGQRPYVKGLCCLLLTGAALLLLVLLLRFAAAGQQQAAVGKRLQPHNAAAAAAAAGRGGGEDGDSSHIEAGRIAAAAESSSRLDIESGGASSSSSGHAGQDDERQQDEAAIAAREVYARVSEEKVDNTARGGGSRARATPPAEAEEDKTTGHAGTAAGNSFNEQEHARVKQGKAAVSSAPAAGPPLAGKESD